VSEGVRDLLILGAGPAGLTAGIYAARARVNCVVLEKGIVGGSPLLTDAIENYPGFPEGITGMDLAEKMQTQAETFGLEIRTLTGANAVSAGPEGFVVETDDEPIVAGSVIVATGAHPNRLGVPGEADFTGRGVSYCATCDGAMFKEKAVAVVGGGDAAVEEALFLTRFATKVTIIHRRDELRAAKILQERALANEKIEIAWSSRLVRVDGDQVVRGATIADVDSGEESALEVDGVFIYVGTVPNSECVSGLVDSDERGFILTDDRLATSARGVFACGDVRASHLRQVATAVGDGALASVSAQKYLDELAAQQ